MRIRSNPYAAALIALGLGLFASRDSSAEPPEARVLPIERLVRQLSLDLRGNVPDMSDYDAVEGASELPDALLDAYLASDDFRIQMRRYHESLLWTNPAASLASTTTNLTPASVNGVSIYRLLGRRRKYRGGDGTAECQAKPQAQLGFEVDGSPKAEDFGSVAGTPLRREGYVEVHPYWEPNPAATIKVCAFDAQTAESFTYAAGTYACDSAQSVTLTDRCGCGANLEHCTGAAVSRDVVSSFREQILRTIDDHTVGGAPYSKLLTSKTAYVNGPISHFLGKVAHTLPLSKIQAGLQPSDGALPEKEYLDETWTAYERQAPHSGVLTLPAYLLRYQTLRGRANRYRIAFRGQYFEPPSIADTGCLDAGDDLTQRCVCRGCHTTLEPIAAHFGKFAEAGTMSFEDLTAVFPNRVACDAAVDPPYSGFCSRFYAAVPDAADPDILWWKLKPLQFADDAHPDIQPNFDAGPLGLAQADIDSGTFHRVAVHQLFEFLMKRPANLDVTSPDYEGATLDAIAANFQQHDSLRKAVRALVTLPSYRRLP